MSIRKTAKLVATRLFQTHRGGQAQRLVQTDEKPAKRYYGGWCLEAVANQVEEAIRQQGMVDDMEIEFEVKSVKFSAKGELPDSVKPAVTAVADFVVESIAELKQAGGVKALIATVKDQLSK